MGFQQSPFVKLSRFLFKVMVNELKEANKEVFVLSCGGALKK